MKLRIPAVLAVTVLGGATAIALGASSCSSDSPPVVHDAGIHDADLRACQNMDMCFPASSNSDVVCTCPDAGNCPTGCVLEPIA